MISPLAPAEEASEALAGLLQASVEAPSHVRIESEEVAIETNIRKLYQNGFIRYVTLGKLVHMRPAFVILPLVSVCQHALRVDRWYIVQRFCVSGLQSYFGTTINGCHLCSHVHMCCSSAPLLVSSVTAAGPTTRDAPVCFPVVHADLCQ